jgi:Ca2+-dependent lipid-binding protein
MWISVQSAKGLLSCDTNGFSGPMAEVSFDGMKFNTMTVYESLSPVWDEEFRVPVDKVRKCWHRDRRYIARALSVGLGHASFVSSVSR